MRCKNFCVNFVTIILWSCVMNLSLKCPTGFGEFQVLNYCDVYSSQYVTSSATSIVIKEQWGTWFYLPIHYKCRYTHQKIICSFSLFLIDNLKDLSRMLCRLEETAHVLPKFELQIDLKNALAQSSSISWCAATSSCDVGGDDLFR
jgi:hypothetical protein